MNTESVFNNNGIIISNPNYNPKTKKGRAQQPFFHSLDVTQDITSGAANEFAKNVDNTWVMGDTHKYQNYGITPNQIDNLDKELADVQSNLRKFGSAVVQSIVSEIGLGTLRGASDLFDFVGKAITGNLFTDNDYTNPISQKLQEWQDYFNTEVAPIYTTPGVDITNGGLTDVGWWASNLPSIMSSVTLLIPSMAATKGLQWLGKASAASKLGTATRNGIKAMVGIDKALAREGGTLNKFQQGIKTLVDAPINGVGEKTSRFFENGLNAALSRTMENYQEGQGVYADMYANASETLNNMTPQQYAEFINKNQDLYQEAGGDNASKDDVAKLIAQKSANQDFVDNYVNIVSDVVQMYGLRNMWKGLKNGEGSSTLTGAARRARQTLGKTPEEIAEMDRNTSFFKKHGQRLLDKLANEKTIIAGELSEGVEEAVNYVAQMEGTHLGNVYLGKEDANSTFDNRLQKYFQSGGLWDSAFWGTIGGIVFHHLGSGFARVKQTLEDRADNKVNKKTQEGKPKREFGLSDTGEIKARKANIESWNNSIETYWKQMKDIKDKKNPFSENETDKKLNTDIDQEQAAQRAYDELITGMTLQAGHSGNLNMLRDYMASDDVRKAMINAGVTDEANSKIDQQKALDKMDEVIDSYSTELKKLINISEATRVTKKQDDILPIEFLQSFATDNVLAKQRIAKINSQIENLDKQINNGFDNEEIKKVLGDEYTPEQYQFAASRALITQELSNLQAERARLMDDKSKMNSISSQVALTNINRLMNKYQDMLDAQSLRYAVQEMMKASYNEDGSLGRFSTKASTTLGNLISGFSNAGVAQNDESIIVGLKKFAKTYSVSPRIAEFENPTDVVKQMKEHGDLLKSLSDKLNKTDGIGIDGAQGNLASLLVNKTALELRKAYQQSQMVTNADNLSEEVSFLNNTLNEGRKKAIDNAYETITNLSDKYDKDKFANLISDAIGVYYNGSKDNIDYTLSFMNETDRAKFTDALDILHLTSGKNYRLGEQIQQFLNLRQAIYDSQERNESHNPNNVDDSVNGAEPAPAPTNDSSSVESSNISPETTSNPPVNNLSPEATESPRAKENKEKSNVSQQKGSQKTANTVGQRVSDFINSNKGITPNVNVDADGNMTVELTSDEANKAKFLTNPDLFDNPGDAIIAGSYAETNPSYELDDNNLPTNIQKGHIGVAPKEDNTGAEGSNENGTGNESSTPFTGGIEQSNNAESTNPEVVNKPAETKVPDKGDLTSYFMSKLRTDGKEIKAGNITADDFLKSLDELGLGMGSTQEDIDSAIASVKQVMQNLLGTKFASSVGEVMLASSVRELSSDSGFGQDYQDAARNMMKQYASEVKLNQRNGKWYGNLEDLLRYVNTHAATKNTADFIYNSLKEYLKTSDGKKNFVMLDAAEVDNQEFLNNVHKTAAERRAEAIQEGTIKRVNIQDIGEVVSPDEIDKSRNELNKVKTGDKLTIKQGNKVDKSTKVLLVQHDGVTIGWLGLPSVNVNSGQYVQVNNSIKYTVGSNSTTDGSVKEWLKSIAEPTTDNARKLDDIIYKVAFDKILTNKEVESFKNNPIVQEGVSKGYVIINDAKGFGYKNALEGLAKLWAYNTNITNYYNPIPESIDLFFDNLRNSYKTANGLIDNNQELTVSKISKGQVLRIAESGKPGEAYKVAQPASKAIAKSSDARIALVKSASQVEVSGKLMNENKGFPINQTVIAIDNGNGTVDYANAYPINWGETKYTSEGKEVTMKPSLVMTEMTTAVEGQIKDRLVNLHNGDSLTNWNDFREFMNKLLDYSNYSTLYKTSGIWHTNSGVDFINLSPTESVKLYKCDSRGTGAPTQLVFMREGNTVASYDLLNNNAAAADALISALRRNANINFSHELLTSDNNKELPLQGFVRRTADGKFEINIPAYNGKNNYNHIEDSYNDFMINNDMLRVDLRQVDGSNYSRVSDNLAATSVLEFTVGADTNAKETQALETPRKRVDDTKSTQDKVKSIITGDSTNKGLDIAKSILPESSVNLLNNTGDVLNLLPKDITFADEEIQKFKQQEEDDNITAMFDSKTKRIVVGNDFLNLDSGRQVRVLIHENLHSRLNKIGPTRHKKFLNNMTEIYDNFSREIARDVEEVNAGKFDDIRTRRNFEDDLTNDDIKNWINNINNFLFKEYVDKGQLDRAKEEFIVESLTNSSLIKYLNKVQVDDTGESTQSKPTIWQRIMNFINKLFGFETVEGSLREKEYNAFAKAFSDDTNTNTNIQTETNTNTKETNTEQTVEEETPIEIPKEDTAGEDTEISNDVNENDANNDDFDIYDFSSRPEYPSVFSSIDSLPLEQHSKFATLIDRGEVSITCK